MPEQNYFFPFTINQYYTFDNHLSAIVRNLESWVYLESWVKCESIPNLMNRFGRVEYKVPLMTKCLS